MKKLSIQQWLGLVLIIAAVIEWGPISFLNGLRDIATVVIIGIGIYFLVK